jgi:uncharacterized RDD family membrane protein YckC
MDQQTPGTQSETGSAPQQSYAPVHHHTPVPAPGQPDVAKRAIAVIIDGVIASVAYTVISKVFGIALGSGLIGLLVGNLAGGLAALGFMLARDVAYQGRSPGKKVMGLNVATASGAPITAQDSIKRNLTVSAGYLVAPLMSIPILGWIAAPIVGLAATAIGIYECYLVLTHQTRVGDKIAGTHVVAEGAPAIAL